MPIEREDLWEALMRYDRELVQPRFDAITDRMTGLVTRDDFNSHVDAMYKRFDRVDSEIATLHLAVRRIDDCMDAIEQRMAALEQKITDLAAKPELDALRSKVDELEHDLAELKQRLAQMESRHERAS